MSAMIFCVEGLIEKTSPAGVERPALEVDHQRAILDSGKPGPFIECVPGTPEVTITVRLNDGQAVGECGAILLEYGKRYRLTMEKVDE